MNWKLRSQLLFGDAPAEGTPWLPGQISSVGRHHPPSLMWTVSKEMKSRLQPPRCCSALAGIASLESR